MGLLEKIADIEAEMNRVRPFLYKPLMPHLELK